MNGRSAELSDELRYRLLKVLEANPEMNQREIAQALGLSLGKVNYCLRAVAAKGWVKARNFRNSKNKSAYLYILTPSGIEEKVKLTYLFLRIKIAEVEQLRREIEYLQQNQEVSLPNADAETVG